MKTKSTYKYDSTDPAWPKRLREAFAILAEFTPELRPDPLHPSALNCFRTSVNRILGGEWDQSDVLTLLNYSRLVAEAARAKYLEGGLVGAPWREFVLLAADRLEYEANDFARWFETERAWNREAAA